MHMHKWLDKIIAIILSAFVTYLMWMVLTTGELKVPEIKVPSFNIPTINLSSNNEESQEIEQEGPYSVIKVVDGDTLRINYNGQDTTVRLIGIDTPESVNPDETKNTPEGKIASDYTKSIVGSEVYLEFDIEANDKYGRLLAYVYLPDGTFLNEKIIRDGYAYTMNIAPNVKYQNLFLDAFNEARENERGLWSETVY